MTSRLLPKAIHIFYFIDSKHEMTKDARYHIPFLSEKIQHSVCQNDTRESLFQILHKKEEYICMIQSAMLLPPVLNMELLFWNLADTSLPTMLETSF